MNVPQENQSGLQIKVINLGPDTDWQGISTVSPEYPT